MLVGSILPLTLLFLSSTTSSQLSEGALEAGTWENLPIRQRLRDGSVLVWVPPSRLGSVCYPVKKGLWVLIVSYRFTDERLDPDRLSFTQGLTHAYHRGHGVRDLAPGLTVNLLSKLYNRLTRTLLPRRVLHINRREVKQISNKYKPKKRDLPPLKPFEPTDRFLDFVDLLDPLAPPCLISKGT